MRDPKVMALLMPEIRPRGPSDLPALRNHLIEQWKPGRLFDVVARRTEIERQYPEGFSKLAPRFDRRSLKEAALWWIDADACELLRAAAPTFPEDHVLEMTDPFFHGKIHGLAVFANPMTGIDSDTNKQLTLDAVLWGPVELPADTRKGGKPMTPEDDIRRGIGIGSYQFINGVWSPLGRSDWMLGDTTMQMVLELRGSQTRWASVIEDRRLLGSIWALARQPKIIEHHVQEITGPARRVAERAGFEPRVNIIRLRPAVRQPSDGSRDVQWRHRWMVKAHWRNQPYGPQRGLRRPVLVSPHMKGPENAPLKIPKPTVWLLEGDQ